MIRAAHRPVTRWARLAPQSARYGYVYTVALDGAGQPRQATEALRRGLLRHPNDRETLAALIGYARRNDDPRQALAYARQLALIEPENADLRRLVQRLETETGQ